MTYDAFVLRLERVKRNPDGSITARCPGHDDRNNSLSVKRGTRTDILAFCFAGCDFPRIMKGVHFARGGER